MKIPLYNKGLGGQGVTTGGSLGPRASYGDFTGVGQATAQLAETAGDIGYKFAIAEKKIETARMSNEEELKFINAADEYNVNSTEIDTSEYERNFTKNIVTPAMNRVERLNVSNGQKKEIKANLLKSYQIKLTKGKKFTWDRGQAVRSNASNSLIDFKLKSVSGLNENDPEFIQGVDSALKLIEDGILQGLSIKTDREKFLQDVELGTISSKRTNATTVEDIDDLEARIKKNTKITEPQKETELNKLNTKKTKIIDNAVAFLIESPTKEIPEDGEDEEIYVSEAELFENIDSALKGDWSFNLGAQAMWNKMSTKDQGRVRAGLVAARTNQQSQIKFRRTQKETNEDDNNLAVKNEIIDKGLFTKGVDPNEIKNAPFQGKDKQKIIESMLAINSKIVEGQYNDPEGLVVYADIARKINTGEIQNASTAFTLDGETKALDLYDRLKLGDKPGGIGFADFTRLESEIKASGTVAGKLAKEKINKLKETLIKTIDSSGLFSSFKGTVARRIYNFSKDLDRLIEIGLGKDIPLDRLLDEKSSDYVMPESVLRSYLLNETERGEEVTSAIEAIYGTKVEPLVLPPVWNETLYSNYEDYLKSDSFIAWRNSRHATKWMNKNNMSLKEFETEFGKR